MNRKTRAEILLDPYNSDASSNVPVSRSGYTCSLAPTFSSTSTESNATGTGRLIDSMYRRLGRKVEVALGRIAQKRRHRSATHDAHTAGSQDLGGDVDTDSININGTEVVNINAELSCGSISESGETGSSYIECSLAPTISRTSTMSDIPGAGRIIDMYFYEVVGRLIEKCLGRIALRVGPGPEIIGIKVLELWEFEGEAFNDWGHLLGVPDRVLGEYFDRTHSRMSANHLNKNHVLAECDKLIAFTRVPSKRSRALYQMTVLASKYPLLQFYFRERANGLDDFIRFFEPFISFSESSFCNAKQSFGASSSDLSHLTRSLHEIISKHKKGAMPIVAAIGNARAILLATKFTSLLTIDLRNISVIYELVAFLVNLVHRAESDERTKCYQDIFGLREIDRYTSFVLGRLTYWRTLHWLRLMLEFIHLFLGSSDYFPETAKTVDELFLVLSEGSDQEARSVFVKECESQTQRILGTVSEFEEVLEKRHCWYEKNEDDEIDF